MNRELLHYYPDEGGSSRPFDAQGECGDLRNPSEIYDIMFPEKGEYEISAFNERRFFRRELKSSGLLRVVTGGEDMRKKRTTIDREAREALQEVGAFLLDIGKLRSTIILPNNGQELQSFAQRSLAARMTGKPIPLYTPFCPDWSQDIYGRYDFKSLGSGVSKIAEKFFGESQPLLRAFQKHKIPYLGMLVFANWGLETEIDAKDTYGRELSPEDIQMCFESTLATTDEVLLELQNNSETASLFQPYTVVRMTNFFAEQGIDPEETYKTMHTFFTSPGKGNKLVEELHMASKEVNRVRLGLSEEENRQQAVQNIAEYATFGHALDEKGMVIAAESFTSTRAYNIPRREKLPVFFIKGKASLDSGVNIL